MTDNLKKKFVFDNCNISKIILFTINNNMHDKLDLDKILNKLSYFSIFLNSFVIRNLITSVIFFKPWNSLIFSNFS